MDSLSKITSFFDNRIRDLNMYINTLMIDQTYIPYSQRNGIQDTFIAKLLDHLERTIGWDIESVKVSGEYGVIMAWVYRIYLYGKKILIERDERGILDIERTVFEQEYTSLLSHYK